MKISESLWNSSLVHVFFLFSWLKCSNIAFIITNFQNANQRRSNALHVNSVLFIDRLFMNVSKPRPNDHPVLIVFVIGGTTSTEMRQIREAVSASKSNVQVKCLGL